MTSIITKQYQDFNVYFTDEGFFNATPAAKRFGKETYDWLRLSDTQEYMQALLEQKVSSQNTKIPGFERNLSTSNVLPVDFAKLVRVKKGSPSTGGGTWLHPKLAIPFARWLNAKFAVWCDQQIELLLRGQAVMTPKDQRDPAANDPAILSDLDRDLLRAMRDNAKQVTKAYLKAGEQPPEYIEYLVSLPEEITMAETKPKPNIAAFKRDPKAVEINSRGRNPRKSKNEEMGYKCIALRMDPEDWLRISDLCRRERESMQRFFIDCISKGFEDRGLPPLVTNKHRKPRW